MAAPAAKGKEITRGRVGIVSLNTKGVQTNMNYVKHLTTEFPVTFLQEHWLYRYQAGLLVDVYDNTEFSCACVDDAELIAPGIHSRGYGVPTYCGIRALITLLGPFPTDLRGLIL